MKMNWTCFTSSATEKPTVVYDENNDSENLWSWNGPLSPCASSAAPDSGCLVCGSDGLLHTVCRNLRDGVKLVMEGEGVTVDMVKSECPRPLSDGDWPWWLLLLLLLLLPLMGVALLVYCKRRESDRAPENLGGELEAAAGAAE